MGSASTGQPADAANRAALAGLTSAPQPATSRPRGWARTSSARRVTSCRSWRARRDARDRPRPAFGSTRSVDQRRARREQRLAKREIEMNRAGRFADRLRDAAAREGPPRHPRARLVGGRTGIAIPADGAAEEVGLVDRLARADVLQLGRTVSRAHDERNPARTTLRPPRDGSWPRPCRRAQHHGRATARETQSERTKRRRAFVENDVHATRSSRASASARGVERDPGADHRIGDARAGPLVDEGRRERRGRVACSHAGPPRVRMRPCPDRVSSSFPASPRRRARGPARPRSPRVV